MPSPSRALITGAGTGIGRAIAERFLSEGWQVVALGRRREPLEDLKRQAPDDVLVEVCDLTDASMVEAMAKRLSTSPFLGGKLESLVNNAGAYERRSFETSDDDLWTAMFEGNVLSAVRLTRSLLPLLRTGRGSIVNVSSTLGLRPVKDTSAYAAAKAAVVNWTQSLALELAADGVRANCVCPGIVDTPLHAFHGQTEQEKALALGSLQPLGRIGQPRDIAHGVWSLAGPGSEWITGATLAVDGGINLI